MNIDSLQLITRGSIVIKAYATKTMPVRIENDRNWGIFEGIISGETSTYHWTQ